jgi:hypothetical protein
MYPHKRLCFVGRVPSCANPSPSCPDQEGPIGFQRCYRRATYRRLNETPFDAAAPRW